ncbi:hypothetical protein AM501_07720 [Aneurinibacillus migulanus]|nr:hypothetical protein [Aneurinibacillus migulanus]KIV54078.1 hypothetical protein TS65_19180 [Aneurinibacillus migulanus]KON97653.1 hypothetical protein AF333_21620 [Aneurinibacillus migulanus]KPD08839.1 hypothetical protein AM501_07720 [Aneurinibacillus migulanus]MED0894406.1 hypothetical protein [Aneurinibacillus migulanus]MED1617016.1 hypothetical protein [Aneurinibacillus migulanus]
MEFYEKTEQVTTKNQFLEFLNLLNKDFKLNVDEWENKSIDNYLEAIESWIEEMEGYYKNNNLPVPNNIDWNFLATIFYVGKIYE